MTRDSAIDNKTQRILLLLSLLPAAPRQKTTIELQRMLQEQGFELSQRSVERYLKELSESEVFGPMIHCNDRDRPYGWSCKPGTHRSVPGLDIDMAVTWDLVRRYLMRLLPDGALKKLNPVFSEAERWLHQNLPPGAQPWSSKVAYLPRGLRLTPVDVAESVLNAAYTGLYQGQQLDIWYKNRPEPMRLHPLALIDRGNVRYLVATFWDYEEPRLVALHRIYRAIVLDERARRPANFNLQEFIADQKLDLPVGDKIQLKLRFFDRAVDHLAETPLSPDQVITEQEDGSHLLEAEVQETRELHWWILGFGPSVEVIGPKTLRDHISEQATKMLSRYQS